MDTIAIDIDCLVRCGRACEFTVSAALTIALNDRSPIIITGSLFTVADAREAWFKRIGLPLETDQ